MPHRLTFVPFSTDKTASANVTRTALMVGRGASRQILQFHRDIGPRPGRRHIPGEVFRDPPPRKRLLFDENQILGRTFAVLTRLQFVFDALSFREVRQTGALNRGNMDKSVLRTIIRADETIPLDGIEPLHGSYTHITVALFIITVIRKAFADGSQHAELHEVLQRGVFDQAGYIGLSKPDP